MLIRARWLFDRPVAAVRVFFMLAFSTTRLAVAGPLLALGFGLVAPPMRPRFALMMYVTPAPLRSQASATCNVLQATGALGSLLIGVLSTWFGENLRLALRCVSPTFLVGAVVVLAACKTVVEDVAVVVAEAKTRGVDGFPP